MRNRNSHDTRLLHERLVVHDFSKFSCIEHVGYSMYDFKDKSKNSDKVNYCFEVAWLHHKHNNDHHPEYWLSVERNGQIKAVAMPVMSIFEMVADWIGAGKTYGSSLEEWLPNNIHTFKFHPKTAKYLSGILNCLIEDFVFTSVGDVVSADSIKETF